MTCLALRSYIYNYQLYVFCILSTFWVFFLSRLFRFKVKWQWPTELQFIHPSLKLMTYRSYNDTYSINRPNCLYFELVLNLQSFARCHLKGQGWRMKHILRWSKHHMLWIWMIYQFTKNLMLAKLPKFINICFLAVWGFTFHSRIFQSNKDMASVCR